MYCCLSVTPNGPQQHLSYDARLVLCQVVRQWAQTFGAVYSTLDADSQYVLVSDNANNRAVIFQPAGWCTYLEVPVLLLPTCRCCKVAVSTG